MKITIAFTAALVSLLLSLGTIAFLLKSKPLGEGIEKYSFTEPLEAYKSTLQMGINQDILAEIQFQAVINERKKKEELQTIKINKSREYGGKTILFIEYNDAGLPKHKIVTMDKDANSGFWHEEYMGYYEIEDKNPVLAEEMKEWK